MGRRNLNPNQIAYLRGKRYESEKKIEKFKGNQYTESGNLQNEGNQKRNRGTSGRLASEYGVSVSTIERDSRFTKSVDILPEPVRKKVLNGEETIRNADASAITQFDISTQKKFIKEVLSGTPNYANYAYYALCTDIFYIRSIYATLTSSICEKNITLTLYDY